MTGRPVPPAVPPPHMEFLVIFFNIYVSFYTHSSFLKMLNGITCREFFRVCTAVFSDMRLISKACKLLILWVVYGEERGSALTCSPRTGWEPASVPLKCPWSHN